MAVQLKITDVGLAAIKDASARGRKAVTVTKVCVGTGTVAPTGAEETLAAEAASVVFTGSASNVSNEIAGSGLFAGADAWDATEIGLWARIGTDGDDFLFAYWSTLDGDIGLRKIAGQPARLALALRFLSAPAAEITFTSVAAVNFIGAPATEAVPGIARWATAAEVADRLPVNAAVRPRHVPRFSTDEIYKGNARAGDSRSPATIELKPGKRFSDYDELSFVLNINFLDLGGHYIGARDFTMRALVAQEWEVYGLSITGGEVGRVTATRLTDRSLSFYESYGIAYIKLITGIKHS